LKRSVVGGILVLLLGVTAGCQSTAPVEPTTRQLAVQPLAGIGTMTPAEMTRDHVRFALSDHELSVRLPDGFCVASERTPAHLQSALADFDVSVLEMKVLATSCAMVEGNAPMGFPIPMVIAGLMRREGLPLVMDEEFGADYARMVRILDRHDDDRIHLLARELFLKSMMDRIETGGVSVGHLDIRSQDNRIRLGLLAEVPVDGADRKVWFFADFLVGPVGDRLFGIGLVNVDLNPTPPATDQDSETLFDTLRQVRN
jgi:hypothetical protein